MTAWNTVIELIENFHINEVCNQMELLSERERLSIGLTAFDAVSSCIEKIYSNHTSLLKPSFGVETSAGSSEQNGDDVLSQAVNRLEAAKIVLLYCSDFTALKEFGHRALPSSEYSSRILLFRKPKWLGRWCQLALSLAPGQQFRTIAAIEKAKLVAVPHDDNYFQALGLAQLSGMELTLLIVDGVISKPELYFAIADPVSVAGMAVPDALSAQLSKKALLKSFRSMVNSRNFDFTLAISAPARLPSLPDNSGRQWPEVLANLASQDVLEREELISSTFRMLSLLKENKEKQARDWNANESPAPFFCRLNNILCEHKQRYVAEYISLVGAVNIVIAYYALQILIDLEVESLPVRDICAVLPQTFRYGDKKNANTALYLVKKILDRQLEAAETDSLGVALVSAFSSKIKSVQSDAVSILFDYDLCSRGAVRDKLETNLDLLEGLNRKRVLSFLSEHGSKVANGSADALGVAARETGAVDPPGVDQLRAVGDIESYPKELANLVGLDDLKSWVSGISAAGAESFEKSLLMPVDYYSTSVPRLFEEERIKDINSVDDLIYLAAESKGGKLDEEQYELLIDGIARLWKDRPDHFKEKVANLTALVREPGMALHQNVRTMLPIFGKWIDEPVAPVVLHWLYPDLFEVRCFGLLSRMDRGLNLPMLARPTHKGGWIDPIVLVDRVREYQKNGRLLDWSGRFPDWNDGKSFFDQLRSVGRHSTFLADAPEFIQALLRLAPDGRAVAVNGAANLKGDFGKALRFALGEGELSAIDRPELALAAYRSVHPFEKDKVLTGSLPHGLPDGAIPAKYRFDFEALAAGMSDRYRSINNLLPDFLSTNSPGDSQITKMHEAFRGNLSCDRQIAYTARVGLLLYPSSYLHNNLSNSNVSRLTWLQNHEPILARCAKELAIEIESISAQLVEKYHFLLEPGIPLYKNGVWVQALMLAAKNDELRRLGLDVLIASIEECRADAVALGHAMASLRGFTVIRWVRSIRELARVSVLHASFAWMLLNSYIQKLGFGVEIGFLEVLLEIQDEFGLGLMEDTLVALKSFSGSGKAAKLARTLIGGGTICKKEGSLRDALSQGIELRRALVAKWSHSEYDGNSG